MRDSYLNTSNHLQSYLKCRFGNVEIRTVQDNPIGVVTHSHVNNSLAGEGHFVKVRSQCEVVAERKYTLREPEFSPGKQFAICRQRVDWLHGSGLVWLTTTCLQRDGGLA